MENTKPEKWNAGRFEGFIVLKTAEGNSGVNRKQHDAYSPGGFSTQKKNNKENYKLSSKSDTVQYKSKMVNQITKCFFNV